LIVAKLPSLQRILCARTMIGRQLGSDEAV
jgi:hypothetical protein